MNKAFITGALGADPEVRTVNDRKVARLRLATSERFKDRATGERRETTEWHSVTLWSPLAEVADQYLAKGSRVTVVGKIRYREWTDRDGVRRWSTEIEATELEILKGKAQTIGRSDDVVPATSSASSIPESEDPLTDDLPF